MMSMRPLLALRGAYPALATGESSYSLGSNVKYLQEVSSGLSVMVVGNFDVVPATGSIPFASAGTWYDYLTGKTIQATGVAQSVTLAPGEYHVYVNKNINAADTAVTDTTTAPTGNSVLLNVYPNPVVMENGNPVITYQLPVAGNSRLVVYSISGAQMGSINLGQQAAGRYTLQAGQWPVNPSGLPAGYYVLKLISSAGTVHVPFLVINR